MMHARLAVGLGILLLLGLSASASSADPVFAPLALRPAQVRDVFLKAYPAAFADTQPDAVRLILKSGEGMDIDDGHEKSPVERQANPDLEDSLLFHYPAGQEVDQLPPDFDPGRVRLEPLLKTVYGGSEEEVRKQLTSVRFCGHILEFNSANGAAAALTEVGADLEGLFAAQPELRDYVNTVKADFSWEFIAGTTQLSPRAFGIAISLNPALSDYWQWHDPAELETYSRKDFPFAIVNVFEKHGFIWGGKWYHFDTGHFEYRPELFALAEILESQ